MAEVKVGVAAILLVLAIVLAVVIGSRLSDQVVAALAGAVCGIGLAGPAGVALGVYIGSTRHHRSATPVAPPAQVIMVPNPAPSAHQPQQYVPGYHAAPGPSLPRPRSFTIIGENDADED